MNGSAESHQQQLTQATFTPGGAHIQKGWVYSSSCLGVYGEVSPRVFRIITLKNPLDLFPSLGSIAQSADF